MLNNVSIKTKLLILLLVPLFLFAVTAVILLQTNSSNVDKLKTVLHDTSNQSMSLILNADRDMYQAYSAYQQFRSRFASAEDKLKAQEEFKANIQQANERIEQAKNILAEQKLLDLTHAEKGVSIEATVQEINVHFNEWSKQAAANIETQAYTIEKETELNRLFEEARTHIDDFGTILDGYALDEVENVTESARIATISTYSILIVEWILLIGFGVLLIRKISQTVRLVQQKTKQISQGDLQYEPQQKYDKDELGQILFSVDSMISKMRETIGSIASNTNHVASSAEELTQSAKESSSAANYVAENIQEVTSLVEVQATIADEASKAMEEMTIGVQKIAESTNQISDHSVQTNVQADQGAEVLQQLKLQLTDMTNTITELNRSITVLNAKSEQIGSITDNITSIANQTGILSLNASIEAARAGEHGKGFAVVAQEIRKLAANSLQSAQNITELIEDTRGEIGHASQLMHTTVLQTEKGSSVMDVVAENIQTIVDSIKEVSEQLHDTSAVTEQMSASSEEVSASMEQSSSSARDIAGKAQSVAAATEEQLALVENMANASEQLRTIVRELNASVSFFKL